MKKVLCLLIALVMGASLFAIGSFAKETELSVSAVKGLERGEYFSYDNVDLSGIKSVSITAYNKLVTGTNGVTLAIVTDNPKTGDIIGYVNLTESGEEITAKAEITPTEGVHDLYFYSLYGRNTKNETKIKKIVLTDEAYVSDKADKKVPDSAIIDDYSDTWAATDEMGRKVASFEEAGPVKEDGREVGIYYWNWFAAENRPAVIIDDVIKEKPSARYEYNDEIWDQTAAYYWGEPVFGFYDSYDYWVYKRHAKMLSVAGVDVIFLDYSNEGLNYVSQLAVLVQAFRDAKAEGVDIPRISALTSLIGNPDNVYRALLSLYFNCFVENDYSDVWYYWEGKPLLHGNATYDRAVKNTAADNLTEKEALSHVENFFMIRENGERNTYVDDGSWQWLEIFPQMLRNVDKETGRPEFVSVGSAINQSTELGNSVTGVFSDPYCKGRGYSEAFGEDYSENGKRMAYFFREQASLALEAEPEFVAIDGWNEWTAIRQFNWHGHLNSFVDTFDYENSRDFEPNNGPLRDDYYLLLCDFVRKYKGVRETPLAKNAKTIDIKGDISAWSEVGPEFYNYKDYARDSEGLYKRCTTENHIYKTSLTNSVKSAKVSYDDVKLYFMAECFDDISLTGESPLNLYINSDRNYITGWEGYDYAVNLGRMGSVSKFSDGVWDFSEIGNVNYNVAGKYITLELDRSLISELDAVDIEFKWTDSVNPEGDILKFYSEGGSAPLGRFNYVYTTIPEKSLSETERDNLYGTSILKAGAGKMIVSGAKMDVYEKDVRVTPFEMNGTLYIPEDTYNEVMGYGRSKTRYDANYNKFYTYHFDLSDDMTEIVNYKWTSSLLDATEVRVNGVLGELSAPVKYVNGIFYIPVSLISECYGYEVKAMGDGVYAIGKYGVSLSSVTNVLSHIN